jgi:hypothetical protein
MLLVQIQMASNVELECFLQNVHQKTQYRFSTDFRPHLEVEDLESWM